MKYLIIFILCFCFILYCGHKIAEYKVNEVTKLFEEKINYIKEQKDKKSELLKKVFGERIGNKPILSLQVTATGYTARKEECDDNPETTANGTPSRVGVIAISRDLEKEIGLSLGQFVLIEGYGLFKIEDRMNSRWKRRIDILHGNLKAAQLFGTRKVEIIWIGKGEA